MNMQMKIGLATIAVLMALSIGPPGTNAADYYFGNFDDQPTYSLVKSYTDPTRSGFYDFGNLQTSANTSTTIGVTTGTQSLAWQPSTVGYYNGLTYNLQTDPRSAADRDATIQGLLANNHLAFNVTWDRNEWVSQHNGDISTQNFSQVKLVYNFGPGGDQNFSNALSPDIDTGNSNFKGGWDPVNYTTPTHTRLVEFDYTPIKAQIQALYTAGTLTGSNGYLEFILVTNAGNYNFPITYYLDSFRFTTPAAAGVQGDYNGNGVVDMADYVLWRNGGPLQNEVNTPGTVDASDYDAWRARFGNTSGAGAGLGSSAVPEPSCFVLLLVGLALLPVRRFKA